MAAVLVELEKSLTPDENSEFRGPCLGSCFVPVLEPEVSLLVSFYPGHIVVSSTAAETVASFRTLNRIVAFNTVLPAGLQTHWLVVLTEINELYVLSLSGGSGGSGKTLDLIVVQHFKLTDSLLRNKVAVDDAARKKVVVAQKCFIRVDETGRFIVVHSCRRFVVVLELKPSKKELFRLASINKIPPHVRKNPELAAIGKYKVFGTPEVYAVDDDMVIDVEVLHSRDANDDPVWSLVLLLRNKRLDYELSFYKLSTRQGGGLESQTRLPAGDTYPNLIIPMNKFVMLIYDTYHMIYGCPDMSMVKDFQPAVDGTSAVELDGDRRCLKQDLFVDSGRNSFFKSYALLDDKTIMLVTASLEYYVVELDYEYIPYDTSSLRTRSKVLIEDSGMQNTLIFRKWDIKEVHDFSSPFQPDEIFFFPEKDSFLIVSKHGQIASFSPGDISSLPTKMQHSLSLPITDLKIDNDSNVSFTSGDLQLARFKSPHLELSSANEVMKDHIVIDPFTIILTEAIVHDVSSSSSHETIERLNVYRPDGSCIATYDMEENVSVTCMVPLNNVKTFKSDDNDFHRNDILEVERSLEKSFLVLTTSANDYDYESDDEFFQRRRTEILLMVINAENDELELKTISVLKAKVDCAEQTNKMVFTLWGVGCSFRLGLQVYKDEEEESKKSSLQVKIIKIGEKLNLPINTVSMVRDLKKGLKLLVDPFFGVYLAKLDIDDKVLSMHEVFEWNMISALDVYSEDMFVAGDLLGNIFLLNMDYTGKDIPSCVLFTSFNCTHGAIGCISCYPEYAKQRKDSLLKVCSAGTSDGAIVSIHVCGDTRDTEFVKALKAQNTRILKKSGIYFEQVSRNLVPKVDLRAVDPVEAYLECEPLMEDRFIKVSLASNNELDEARGVPVVFL